MIIRLAALMGHTIAYLQRLQDKTRTVYGKPLTTCIGYDPQRTDWKAIAPVVAILPLTESEDKSPQNATRRGWDGRIYTIGLAVGVVDEAVISIDGVPCLRGLEYLATAVSCIRETLPDAVAQTLPDCTLTGGDIRYDTERHPLLQAEILLTLTLNRPIGG